MPPGIGAEAEGTLGEKLSKKRALGSLSNHKGVRRVWEQHRQVDKGR